MRALHNFQVKTQIKHKIEDLIDWAPIEKVLNENYEPQAHIHFYQSDDRHLKCSFHYLKKHSMVHLSV